MTPEEKYKDTVRCMSEVLTEIASALGVPENLHGEPEVIFDAIDDLRGRQQADRQIILELVEALSDVMNAVGNVRRVDTPRGERLSIPIRPLTAADAAIQRANDRLKEGL